MAGHNKWSKVKHKKAAVDAKKSKEFSKLARLIAAESKRAGGDVNSPNLRTVLEKARKANMPKDNIERAVAKGTSGTGAALEHITYEAYGPGGTALIIEVLSDSRNRSAQEIKYLLSKYSIELASPGSALWAFEKTGGEWIPKTIVEVSEEDGRRLGNIIDALLEHDDIQDVYTNAT